MGGPRKKLFKDFTPEDLATFRRSFVRARLRNASFAWPFRTVAKNKSRIIRGLYSCAICGKQIGNSEIQQDHVEPVVIPEEGFVSWDKFIERLFVDEKGWQSLCFKCHKKKTEEENARRKEDKRKLRG